MTAQVPVLSGAVVAGGQGGQQEQEGDHTALQEVEHTVLQEEEGQYTALRITGPAGRPWGHSHIMAGRKSGVFIK